MQIPEIMMYVYDNLKRKWKERQQTEVTGSNIILSVADSENYKESLTQNFERVNKEIQNIVAKMNVNERKLENIELSIADMKKTHHVNK